MKTDLKIKHTRVFTKNYEAFRDPKLRFIVNTGGSRSSKTWSIIQLLVYYALTHHRKRVSVVRKTSPALFASVYQDLLSILHDLDIYDLVEHNKSGGSFTFPTGTVIKFFSIDDPQKLRGRKHDLVFINEGNEITREEFTQINMRTTSKIIIDWNPSDPFSWIVDLTKDEKAINLHSTYTDNPFLEPEIIREIENLISVDEAYYQIYALGQFPAGREKVFAKFDYEEFPDDDDDFVYGMDFGWSDPSVIVRLKIRDGHMWIREELYERYLNPEQLVTRMREIGIQENIQILADSSRPDLISHLNAEGFYVSKANKAIKEGLDFIRMHRIHLDPQSRNLIQEFQMYSYKKVKDTITDTPSDFMNHAIDSTRYAAMSLKNNFSISFGHG
jgi:phage terminase large subunit